MARFPDTQWSLIRHSRGTPSGARAAFAQLAQDYRPAIFAFFRARLPAADAEDAAQSFLAASFEHQWWARADAQMGSFRGFLLVLLRRHLARLRSASPPAESLTDPPEPADPGPEADRQFDAQFALQLTRRALRRLRDEYRQRDRAPLFDQLVALLGERPAHGEIQALAVRLNMPPNTLTIERIRLRERLRRAMRDELQQLCADGASFDADWQALQAILSDR